MAFVHSKSRPADVELACHNDDKQALSRMGRAGNIAAAISRAVNKDRMEQIRADALMHGEETRAGWDDSYDPTLDGEVVWFN